MKSIRQLINIDFLLGILADTISIYIVTVIPTIFTIQWLNYSNVTTDVSADLPALILLYILTTVSYTIYSINDADQIKSTIKCGKQLRTFIQKTF